jgi:hypothetical protein
MRYFTLFIVVMSFLYVFGCSKNENNPLSSDDNINSIKVTVTYGQEYYINLSRTELVNIENPLLEDDWDLLIDNLTRISLNGGSTGPGGVYSHKIDGVDFESVSVAPPAVFDTDTQDKLSIGEDWYYYDFNTHSVNPLDVVYVLKATDGNFYKLQIIDAVFPSRTDGELTIGIERVEAPDNFNVITSVGRVITSKIALSGSEEGYFNFIQARPVTIIEETTSLEWHLKSDFVTMYLNGGTSGSGTCAARLVQDVDFDSVSSAPAGGYAFDDSSSTLAIGDSWYTYNMSTHTLTPNSFVYILQVNQADYIKIAFILTDFSTQNAGVVVIRHQYVEGTRDF